MEVQEVVMRRIGDGQWRLLALGLLLLLPLLGACGGTATQPGGQVETPVAVGSEQTQGIVPLEGWALSGQNRAGKAGQPSFLAFDAYG